MDLDDFESLGIDDESQQSMPKSSSAEDALKFLDNQWYTGANRRGRMMDLIGDYAGSEMFVVDGDSLLQIVLDDDLLALAKDDDPSFQILHAKYSLECLINDYFTRSAVFEICFFEENRHLVLQTGSPDFVVASRFLARRLLLDHLYTLDIPIHVFAGLSDPGWTNYLKVKRPMFVAANDGGILGSSKQLNAERIFVQRTFVFYLLQAGITVSLLQGAQFKDTKIIAFIYEGRRKTPKEVEGIITARPEYLSNLDAALTSVTGVIDEPQTRRVVDLQLFLTCLARRFMSTPSWRTSFSAELLYIFIAHCIVIPRLYIEERARPLGEIPSDLVGLLRSFLAKAFVAVGSTHISCDVRIDIDGRIYVDLLRFILSRTTSSLDDVLDPSVSSLMTAIWSSVGSYRLDFSGLSRAYPGASLLARPTPERQPVAYKLLPFHNDIFDAGLEAVHIDVGDEPMNAPTGHLHFQTDTMFTDNSHWHNTRRHILPKYLGGEDPKPIDERQRIRRLRNEQFFLKNLQRNAASLTGASGVRLDPIIIAPVGIGAQGKSQVKEKVKQMHGRQKGKAVQTSTQKLRDQIMKEKHYEQEESNVVWWKAHLDKMASMDTKKKLDSFSKLQRNRRLECGWLALETRVYKLHLELTAWTEETTPDSEQSERYRVSVLRMLKNMSGHNELTASIVKLLTSVLISLGLGDYSESLYGSLVHSSKGNEDKALSFKFIKLLKSTSGSPRHKFMKITEHPVIWQLRYFGEYMDRSMGSTYDSRVSFEPDKWQRDVLDAIDRNSSILAVAPTSAGKTFISYYAMEKVLRSSDDAILVYVAPTKALVTQIAAEVYARFRKDAGRSCWAIHTRDDRVNNPLNCQILITVPEILATLILSPSLARVWTPRIRWIILDEIHSIGQEESGTVWEQILLLSPCPIIGLSATVGSPEEFNRWLSSVQEAHGFNHVFIHHPHRYSHLRKYYYVTSQKSSVPFVGLDDTVSTSRLCFLHPISLLSPNIRSLPIDLALEAKDTLTLWEALVFNRPSLPFDIDFLEPTRFFRASSLLGQQDIIQYEKCLKDVLAKLIDGSDPRDDSSMLRRIVQHLENPKLTSASSGFSNLSWDSETFKSDLINLLTDLHKAGDLPALLFSFDRLYCMKTTEYLQDILATAEERWRSRSPMWQKTMKEWEDWRSRAKERERTKEKLMKQKKALDQPDEPEESTWHSSFDPTHPSAQFSFAGTLASSELEDAIKELSRRWRGVPKWLMDALRRGIGVHHAGLNKAYRSLVESFFRTGFLRVVIATGTLALGINAPTKTCVFLGDSPYLTALQYRQCAGRAGRRGYDLLGKVVFYGLPIDRVQRLAMSKLPSLVGHFPVTSTLCLRLFNLMEGSDRAPTAVRAVRSLLTLPHISFASQAGKEQLLHHLRFSIDYLRRARLLDQEGKAMNLYGIAAHLYYTEPSNLALVALLRAGTLHQIAAQSSMISARRDFIILMCHLFNRRYIPRTYVTDENLKALVKKSPSKVLLPPLPDFARDVLVEHDKEILNLFTSYALMYASQHEEDLGRDDQMPLSKAASAKSFDAMAFRDYLRDTAIRPIARSLFVANSGHDDKFRSIHELTRSARPGLHLNPNAIPSLEQISSGRGDGNKVFALNAYLLDFYAHGQTSALEIANGIRKGDIWYILQDFDLCLATVRGALEQLLTRASQGDPDSDSEDLEGQKENDLDSGYGTLEAAEMEDNETSGANIGDGDKPSMERPANVSDADWKVYEMVDAAYREFHEKFGAMWA